MESRIPRLIPGALSLVLLAACGDATESSPGKSLNTSESELRQTRQALERSRQTLAVAEGQLSTLVEERSRDHRRIADMSANYAALEKRNRDMSLRLTQAREQLARGANARNSLRQQRDQNARRVRELDEAYQAMSARLAGAYAEIRRLGASRSPDQRQIADSYHRSAAAARELTELRRYNSYLLQERSNLQAWLQKADATREKQRDALRQSRQEADRDSSRKTASNKKLRQELETSHRASADLKVSRDALAEEASTLRESVALATQAERSRGEQAAEKIAQLQAAKSYLVEKVEICTERQQSSRAQSRRHAWNLALLSQALDRNSEAAARQQKPPRFMTAQWQPGPNITLSTRSPLIPVAGQSDEQADGTRHKKELKQTKQKLKKLEQEQEALTKELQELEAEYAAIKKQVQTLTWANEVLVKELDAAYATGTSAPLPEGTRGIYVLRQGESLSRVANAFYGDPERWKDIVAANKDKIPDPNVVRAGTIILIPE